MADALFAEPAEVASFAADLPEKYLACRDTGHVWRPFDARVDKTKGCYVRSHRCMNCRSLRHQHLTFSGGVIRTAYEHSDGYLSDIGRIAGEGRDVLRLESIQRALGKRQVRSLQRRYSEAS